jgi:hypothetical protein
MVTKFLPGSFTKQFGWRKDPERLHRSIRNGFQNETKPVTRDIWRSRCGLRDSNIDLIPMDFFLYSRREPSGDYLLVDTFVELALSHPYDAQFAKLAVFDFHLANSGNWRGSDWPKGDVAGWANMFIREIACKGESWSSSAFDKQALLRFFDLHVEAVGDTRRKMRNNYRFMLERAGLLVGGKITPTEIASLSTIYAPQLFWDRQIFDGKLRASSPQSEFEDLFVENEIFKILNCGRDQGVAVARSAFREYSRARLKERFKQLETLLRAAA